MAGLSVGGHTITAAYAGNANYLASQGNVNQTVTANPAPTVVGSAKFTDNGNGTITDNKTGLIWQVPVPNLNWEAALTLCTSSALLGQTDWHLPDINELSSLTFTTATGAIGIDANLFPGGNGLGWSATSDVTDPLQAWIIGQELTPTLLNKLSQQAATCVRTPPTTGQ
ncbi:MAG: DUF1566 domain-containing protein [Desulfobulbaceae bacterium]|nr:DUF1566 domain-containing protein [Desulfobulbaceae bacterium]